MALFFPLLDTGLGLLLLLGSPGIGYIILRCVIISSQYWQGWKRLLVASIIGGGWSYSIFSIVTPLMQTNVSVNILVDYFAYAGTGLFALTALASLSNRLIISRVLASYFPARTTTGAPAPISNENGVGQMMYKPSQLRAASTKTPLAFAEPTLENDVLSLLKEESFEGKKKTKKVSRDKDELVADNPDDLDDAPTRERKRAPMEDLGEFAGFEETLTQLKRDLKDFNENVTRPTTRRATKVIP